MGLGRDWVVWMVGAAILLFAVPGAAAVDLRIRLNSIGFLPGKPKQATVAMQCSQFRVLRAGDRSVALEGAVSGPLVNADTNEELWTADFSQLDETGSFILDVPGVGQSAPFRIAADVYDSAFQTVMRGMYLWRCGTAVHGTHNGQTFRHEACHMNDGFLDVVGGGHVRRDGTGGWHDAGDYNKYVTNAGITVGMMLQAWEQFGDRLKDARLDLPESGNGIPDVLNEIRWEVEWVLKMQADDGSVYHKLSARGFCGFIMPEAETEDRLYTPWSTAATGQLVAMAAMMARAIEPSDRAFAQRCLNAARRSYAFLTAHEGNHQADLTGFRTGGYQTRGEAERLWAAVELWQTTGEPAFLQDFENRARATPDKIDQDWDWQNVRNLAMFTYLLSRREGRDPAVLAGMRRDLLATADRIVDTARGHGYARPMGSRYYWGCNGTVARQTMVLQIANQIAPRPEYVNTSLDALGHLFGRNCFGRSQVTGLGAHPPMHPHDRRSGADGVEDPWPGYLVGGPQKAAQDWHDEEKDFRTNEIALNWNGALMYALAAFVEGGSR